jgi:hypothetical protein
MCETISKYEPLYFEMMFGYSLYKDMIAALSDPDNVDQIWADFIDGTDYQLDSGEWVHYDGVRPGAARYVFYWYQRTEYTQSANLGQVIPNYENGTVTSAAEKMITQYNQAIALGQASQRYLDAHSDDFPSWAFYGGSDGRWFVRNLCPPYPNSNNPFGFMNRFNI